MSLKALLNFIVRQAVLPLVFIGMINNVSAGPGAVDTTFNVAANNSVNSVLTLASGKILVGGAFSTINGVQRPGLARLYPDGSLDTTYSNAIASGTVFAMQLQPDGKLLVGGLFSTLSGSRQNIARLNVDGSVDGTFTNSAPNSMVLALGLQNDGKVIIGGQFTFVGNSNHYYIARLNTDGTVDNAFNAGTISGSSVNAIAVQPDGNILIGGSFTYFSTYNLSRNYIARLTTNGTPDLNYQANANSSVQSVFLQNDGKSVWAGNFNALNSNTRTRVGRLNSDGSLDSSFTANSGANSTVYAVTEDINDNIYVAGAMSAYNNATREGVARVFSDGTLDSTFNNSTNFSTPQIHSVAVQSDGKVLLGGSFTTFNSLGRTNLVRLYGDNYPAEITTQPRGTNLAVGATATFSVEVSNPTLVDYQWYKNGVAIAGATDYEYSVFNVQLEDAANYSVYVNTSLGGTTSSNAVLQVGIPPTITQQPTPSPLTVSQGQTATFTAAASGTPLNYFWKYGQTLVGTNATLTLTNVTPGQAGNYVLTVSNFLGSSNSLAALLLVQYPVSIVTNPASQSVVVGNAANLSVSVTGYPLYFQWLQNSNVIPNANNPAYSVPSATLSNVGAYVVVVSNQFNSVTSTVANLAVGIPPQNLQSRFTSNHLPQIQMTGTPGFNYALQLATNLQMPVKWQTIATFPTDTNGVWTGVDTNTPFTGARFYRATLF